MEPISIFFIALVLGTIVLSPFFAAESRPGFLRPDRKSRPMMSTMRPSEWDSQGWDR
jgi:hypothetical protein